MLRFVVLVFYFQVIITYLAQKIVFTQSRKGL